MRLAQPVWRLVVLASVSAVSGTSLYAAQHDSAPVMVKDMSVRPLANLSYMDHALVVHPKMLLGAGHNSNIYATETGEESDAYGRGMAGLEIDWRVNEHSAIGIHGEIEGVHYIKSENDAANMAGGLANAEYRWREATNEVTVNGGWQRYDDPLIETGQQILRENYNGAVNVDARGATARAAISARIDAINYLQSGRGFTDEERDNTQYSLLGRVGINTARDTYYYALAGVDRREYWTTTRFNNSYGVTAGLGAQIRLGDRATLTAEGGAQYRMYDENYANSDAYDDKDFLAPYANVQARWPWETGSYFGINLFSRTDESLTANASWVYGGGIDGRYRLLQHSALFGSAIAYRLEDSGSASGAQVAERDTYELTAGFEHDIMKGLVGRIKGSYTDSDATGANSFSRVIAACDIAVAF
jgi:Putative beta-barrel porin 2